MNSFSQKEKSIENYVDSFNDYNKYYQEYFYTQFNKSSYFPGENIWFQIYIVDKQKQKLAVKTKKVYAGFYNSEGKIIKQIILKSEDGIANYGFKVPNDYTKSKIFLKVSTDWSKNYHQEYINDIQINVQSDEQLKETQIIDRVSKVYFFPESGHLIEDIPTRIGVKIIDKYNNGFSFLGEIEDEAGNLIVTFETNNLGLGNFTIHPQKGKKYRLREFFTVDKKDLYLPVIKKKGILFNVLNSGSEFKIFFRTNHFSSNHNLYHYIIYNQYNIEAAGSFNFNGGISFLQKFNKKELLKGLNIITLFDANFKPIAERIFFNSEGIHFSNDILSVTNFREKDSAMVKIFNHTSESIFQIAVSILPKESVAQTFQRSFLSEYYLSSEVKGYIENPTFYFKSSKNIKELDNLLLTQGWRKFDWENIRLNKTNKLVSNRIKFLFETGISIEGRAVNKSNNSPLENEMIVLFYKNLSETTTTDKFGNFSFDNLEIKVNDTIKLYLNPDRKVKKNIIISQSNIPKETSILIPSKFERKIKPIKTRSVITDNFESNINIYDEGEKLDEVELFVKKDSEEEKTDIYVNPMDNTTFTESFYVNKDNVDKFRSVLSYLETLPGLEIVANGSQIKIFSSRTMQQSIVNGAKRPIDVYIENTKLNDLDIETLGLMDMNGVRNINVNKSGIGFGGESPFGRITIYPNYKKAIHSNRFEKKIDESNLIKVLIEEGFSTHKKYFNPDYKLAPEDEFYKKYATIHWEPGLKITKKGGGFKIKIPKSINECVLIIEGISENGNIISLKKDISLKEPEKLLK